MSTDAHNPVTTSKITCPQVHAPAGSYHPRFSLVLVFAFALALAYRYLVRPGLQWLLASDTAAFQAPDIAPDHNPTVSEGRGAPTPKHRTSRVEQGVNQKAAGDTKGSPQLRRAKLGLAVTQGAEPGPRGYDDEAREANSQHASLPSPTPSARNSNSHGSSPGVAQLVDDTHVDTTLLAHLPDDTALADASEARGAYSHVAHSVLPIESIRTQPPWYISLSPREIELRESVLSPHSRPHTRPRIHLCSRSRRQGHLYDAIEQVLAATGGRSGYTWCRDGHATSPSTHSQLSTAGGARNSSLVKALEGWDLSKRVAPLALLAVGVSGGDLPGPDHDLKWIARTFPAVILYPLKGIDATQDGIQSALAHTFENAESVLAVILYFTGHGEGDNAFKLYDGQLINEATLFTWIDKIRRTTGKHLPVFLVFDFCREDPSVPPVSTHGLQDVYIIWACTPGERSFEVNLGDDLPYSDLLKVVCLALHKMRPYPPESPRTFMEEVTDWVSCILKIHRTIICGKRGCALPWNECRCPECRGGRLCSHLNHLPEDYPPIQKPVGWFSGFGDDVDINRVLHAMRPFLRHVEEPIQNVATGIVNNKWYLKSVPQDPSKRLSSSSGNLFQPVSASVPRGPSGALAVAPTPPLPCDPSG
ncbi:hypothetical protein FRC08_018388 [Ceratobasidium sp. 394]|nr:hypothetical protein FRC08_018388 [Ceratobasidium sp. 394]